MPRRRQVVKRVSGTQRPKIKREDKVGIFPSTKRKQEDVMAKKEEVKKVEEKLNSEKPKTKFGEILKPKFQGGVEKPPILK